MRVEQLAPFPFDKVAKQMRHYPNAEVRRFHFYDSGGGVIYTLREGFGLERSKREARLIHIKFTGWMWDGMGWNGMGMISFLVSFFHLARCGVLFLLRLFVRLKRLKPALVTKEC